VSNDLQLNLFEMPAPYLALSAETANPGAPTRPRLAASDADFAEFITRLSNAEFFAFDTETTGLDMASCDLVGISVCMDEGEGWYVPVEHPTAGEWSLKRGSRAWRAMADGLARPGAKRAAHNAKFDLGVLKRAGLPINQPVYDTLLAQFALEPLRRGSLGLKALAREQFGWQMTEIAELIGHGGAGKTQFTMRDVPLEIAARYAAADADATFRLAQAQQPRLKVLDLERLLYEVEFPLVPVLADMELTGVAIDAPYLGALSAELGRRMTALEKEIYAQAGKPFNVGSTEQLANVLYRVLGLPVQTRSDGERVTTSAWALEDLRGKHPIVPMVLEYRELSKLKGTYADALPALVNPRTGRVHTTFNQGVVITGRLSSSNPNLQNIPIVSEMGRRVRKAFIAQPGGEVLSADYSQVELRILAHLANDPMLREAFERDEDIHKSTAAAIYNVPLADVTTEQRGFAKRVNFGIAYGMGARSLAASANMTERQAEQFIAQYFRRFSRVKAWLDGTRREMNMRHSVQTMFGRRRPFDDMRGKSVGERNRAERLAINHPVQGTAAEVIKIAMVKLHSRLNAGGYASRITLQVHDELVLDVAPGELDEMRQLVREEMETAVPLSVRLKAEVTVGPNWDDAE